MGLSQEPERVEQKLFFLPYAYIVTIKYISWLIRVLKTNNSSNNNNKGKNVPQYVFSTITSQFQDDIGIS